MHDRTINETSSEEEEEEERAARRNPLENIAEEDNKGNENLPILVTGNPDPAHVDGNPVPIQVAGNPQNPESDDDNDNMANWLPYPLSMVNEAKVSQIGLNA